MPVINNRNSKGVKDSANCYSNDNGKLWLQWSDFYTDETNTSYNITKENKKLAIDKEQKENPAYEFKVKKVSGIYRMYYTEK